MITWERIKSLPGIILEWRGLWLLILGGVAGYSGNEVVTHYYPTECPVCDELVRGSAETDEVHILDQTGAVPVPATKCPDCVLECPVVRIPKPECRVEVNSSSFSQLMEAHEREHHE